MAARAIPTAGRQRAAAAARKVCGGDRRDTLIKGKLLMIDGR